MEKKRGKIGEKKLLDSKNGPINTHDIYLRYDNPAKGPRALAFQYVGKMANMEIQNIAQKKSGNLDKESFDKNGH